jgi:hypothetical protein
MYGVCASESEIKEMMLEKGAIDKEDLERYGIFEDLDKLDFKGLTYRPDYDGGCVFIGRSYRTLKDDETGGEFKQSAESAIKEIFGKEKKCEEFMETIYN